MKQLPYIIFYLFILSANAQISIEGYILDSKTKEPIEGSTFVVNSKKYAIADSKGYFKLSLLENKETIATINSLGYKETSTRFLPSKNKKITIYLETNTSVLNELVLTEKIDSNNKISLIHLKPIEGTTINAGKKNEVILLRNLSYNTATNSSRQIFSQVPGLNIWESDQTGLQLEIGARGLSPQRTSNFNTRQNGYDISADALGYPETYYTPPTQATEKIQLIRGAASLQYGSQFGGMLNFKLKKGNESKKIETTIQQSVGSNQLFSTFVSLGGQVKNTNYYTFGQYKTSKGWRPNSSLESINFHLGLEQQISENTKLKFDYSKLKYTAQQPGGLTDEQFETDPHQSNRYGNWFQVDWNVFGLRLEHKFNSNNELSSQFFGLIAERNALGYLLNISWDEKNFTTNRDLILSTFNNIGNETKWIKRYKIKDKTSALLLGTRYYQGKTRKEQGYGNVGLKSDFSLFEPEKNMGSFYDFPSKNFAFFAENIFQISSLWSVTPGLRIEYINTEAEGYNQLINPNTKDIFKDYNSKNINRSVFLLGIGSSYNLNEDIELYTNISSNYRAINFNDLYENNYNIVIDNNLKDESGYNADLGFRGKAFKNKITFDASLFYLKYADRIGFLNKTYGPNSERPYTSYRLKTNISDSRTYGVESYLSYLFNSKQNKKLKFRIFNNLTLQKGIYVNSDDVSINEKEVELIPNITWKIGINAFYKRWQVNAMSSYIGEQYSDAQNSLIASKNALSGLIPSYHIVDISLKYKTKNNWQLGAGINNILNNYYFTRRATGYPGPGIIPSPNRNYFLSIQKTI